MKVLILGGTGFLGREIASVAINRGHEVTCVARGNGPVAIGCKFVKCNRNDPDALRVLEGGEWDGAVDLTSQPIHAYRAVSEVTAKHWVYVSSSSVYADGTIFEADENTMTLDPLQSDYMASMAEYGAAKSACEHVFQSHIASVSIIRPGLIGGYGDETSRSGYYPWRFANPTGVDVLVPDDTFPIAMLDVKDLARWIVSLLESRTPGIFNAGGPTITLSDVLAASKDVAKSLANPRVLDDEFLIQQQINPWIGPRSLPLWVPGAAIRNFATLNSEKARALGLVTRDIQLTLADALEYESRRSTPPASGLSDDEEQELRRIANSRN